MPEPLLPSVLASSKRNGKKLRPSPNLPVDRFAFGGPAGAIAFIVALPSLVYYFWLCVDTNDGAFIVPHSLGELGRLAAQVPLPSAASLAIYGAWLAFQGLLQLYVPGKTRRGMALDDGTCLEYKMNGWASFLITWAALGFLCATGLVRPTLFYDQFGPLLTTANLFAFGYSLWLYRHGAARIASGGKERIFGSAVHDFFMGMSLNPRSGRFDHKLFCAARPGLILWTAGNLSFAARQYEMQGRLSTPMVLLCAFQFFYVADYFFHEEAILSTWDIKHENFGFMLCWGDLVWVPFSYTLQAHYLIRHARELPAWAVAGIVLLNALGYYLFRAVNLQKHRFRSSPERPIWGKPPEVLKTARGTPLLLSGYWGLARHMNYLGDLMMGLAWCLVCGFAHLLPYFYIVYFAVLLLLRERRDHATCKEKYGADWDAYCARVRWRIIPGIY